jgi:hypothetical protein
MVLAGKPAAVQAMTARRDTRHHLPSFRAGCASSRTSPLMEADGVGASTTTHGGAAIGGSVAARPWKLRTRRVFDEEGGDGEHYHRGKLLNMVFIYGDRVLGKEGIFFPFFFGLICNLPLLLIAKTES